MVDNGDLQELESPPAVFNQNENQSESGRKVSGEQALEIQKANRFTIYAQRSMWHLKLLLNELKGILL